MKRLVYEIVLGACTCVLLGVLGWYAYTWGYSQALRDIPQIREQHELCYDTDKYEAWVARKDGFLRCFMEFKQYPHRVRASHID